MTTGTEPPPVSTREPAAPPTAPSDPLLYGAGQSAWLAVVTAVAFAALIVALLALWMNRGSGGTTAAAPAGSATVEVDGGEFFFDPEDSTATAGDVEVVFSNVGNIEHEWVALQAGTEIASEGEFEDSMVLHRIPLTAAGESASESFAFEAGEYQVICTIPGHFAGGMHGTLVVE